jgi:hypothetical protein
VYFLCFSCAVLSTERQIIIKETATAKATIGYTRWSVHTDATEALMVGYVNFVDVLDDIADDANL